MMPRKHFPFLGMWSLIQMPGRLSEKIFRILRSVHHGLGIYNEAMYSGHIMLGLITGFALNTDGEHHV